MIETNALLSIGLALITNFTGVVNVPRQAMPDGTNDLMRYNVGSPGRPTDLALFYKNGTCFWISVGIVQAFESSDSYFLKQDTGRIAEYAGEPVLSSNQVAQLAISTIERLAKRGNPIANLVPRVEQARPLPDGKQVPFYRFTWPPQSASEGAFSHTAQIEIDARKGQIVYLVLRDPGFFDFSHGQFISNAVYSSEPKRKTEQSFLPTRDRFPLPTRHQVEIGISNWLVLCKKLDLVPGSDTDLDRIDWDRTYLYTNRAISARVPVCQVRFRNGACFESIAGVIISHISEDACFVGAWDDRPIEEWRRFYGKISRKWEDLAKDLETALVEKCGLSRAKLRGLSPAPSYVSPEYSTQGLVRCVVRWHESDKIDKFAGSGIESSGVLAAEFDLQSGEVRWISIYDPQLLGWQ